MFCFSGDRSENGGGRGGGGQGSFGDRQLLTVCELHLNKKEDSLCDFIYEAQEQENRAVIVDGKRDFPLGRG